MFRTYEHVLEENIKMWGIIHVHEILINMWEYNLWECRRLSEQLVYVHFSHIWSYWYCWKE